MVLNAISESLKVFSAVAVNCCRASSLKAGFRVLCKAPPNPSFQRTHSGRPALAFISFWAKASLPPRAAQLPVGRLNPLFSRPSLQS